MTATRKPQRVFDQRPRFVAYVPVRVRLVAGEAPVARVSLPVRTGRLRPSERR